MKPDTVIKMTVQRMICTACGAEANASCNCGKPYMPAKQRAADAIAANPEKSNRAIAAEIGVSPGTVDNARKQLPNDRQLSPRVGKDGKARRMPVRADDDDMPTEAEADESWQRDLLDQACLILEQMAPPTRQKYFTLYASTISARARS